MVPAAGQTDRAALSVRHAPAHASSTSTSSKSDSRQGVSVSTLATENDLFSAALKAGRAGDRREAVELLDVLLSRFPNSPLKQSAESARAKLSESIPPAR